ncbi:CREB-binding protein-like [Bradysia coprophila]|uniref:CREB-binding protein-like n=1 Tax=Bradysia coprophila TaxID=38358 RepID=UPI00187DCB9F|nr:CREB-binding protein-like [Bradysia coprophila]XP_037026645.1 CREB-binding protein-like [Bradysia coprophila]
MNTQFPSKRRRDERLSSSTNNSAKKSRKTITPFNPHYLRQALLPTLDVILASKLSKSFRIHLSTIKDKLSNQKYTDARDYVEDVWSMFEDYRLSNPGSQHYTELGDAFQFEVDPIMQSLGYCCGKNYRFGPQKLCCSLKKECTIMIGAHYFTYQIRHNICELCFANIPSGETVTLGENSPSETRIRTDQFMKVQNNVTTPEPLIECQNCGRRQHKICALYSEKIWPNGFVCNTCLAMNGAKRDENPFRAKNLPVTQLDGHIEARVNDFLKQHNFDGGRVYIRMLLNVDRNVIVMPAMRSLFVESGELSASFPYRSKAIFAFQEINGLDVCFFGMYVQEYGSECPEPNTRRVYVEFLDSVNLFQPKRFKTDVYREILLGYIDFAKQLGYAWLHIWACPPPLGENYIFSQHPTDQKVPDSVRLQRWYTKILRKGKSEQIVEDYKNILQQYKDDVSLQRKENSAVVARLPYFDDDYWPYFFEETVEKMDEEAKVASSKRKRRYNGKRKTKKQKNCNVTARKNRLRSSLRSKLLSTMTELSANFFSVQLHSAESVASLEPIRDPDSLMDSFIMNGHSAFFDFTRDNNYEFSSLRRAQFSTMCILYELHNEELKNEHYYCNNCEFRVDTRYNCRVCEDYDLCVDCKEKIAHVHEMDKVGPRSLAENATKQPSPRRISSNETIEIDSSDDDSKAPINETPLSPSTVRLETDAELIQTVTSHACTCSDRNCRIPSCQTMRCFAHHLKSCQRARNSCPICKTLNTLLSSHSDSCQNVNCSYSFCQNNTAQMQRQQQQRREKQHKDTMMNIAATLQKTSLKMLNNCEVWTDQQFMLDLAFQITSIQIQLQQMIGAKYADSVALGTTASLARDQGASTQSGQFMDTS